MNHLVLAIVLLFSFSVYADIILPPQPAVKTIKIPLSNPNLFGGGFSGIESELMEKIKKASIEACGSIDKVSYKDVAVNFRVSGLYRNAIESNSIQGPYPRAGATLTLTCDNSPRAVSNGDRSQNKEGSAGSAKPVSGSSAKATKE